MILCVNLNAAIDKTLVVENYAINAIHRPQALIMQAGGKGCNAARSLRVLGQEAIVTGCVGGYAGRFIESNLRREGIRCAFVHTAGESRTCLSVFDPAQRTMTEIYERGEPVTRSALAALQRKYRALLGGCQMVTLSGSLPAGVPLDFYARLIQEAHAQGVPAMLDAGGEALRHGLASRPRLAKPNRHELSAMLGRELTSLAAVAAAAHDLARCWQTLMVVSLGADGAVAADGDDLWHARPPAVAAQSAVGSGDAMLAGLAATLLQGRPLVDGLRLGTAAGAANTLALGAGKFRIEDVRVILPAVSITRLAPASGREAAIHA